MRLGGGIDLHYKNPEEWLAYVKELNYSAVLSPVNADASSEEIHAYRVCAEKNDIVIGEVGVWQNPLDPDDEKRKSAIDYATRQLALADEIGARCCVNIVGSRGKVWDGCYADNYTEDTYAMIIDTTRHIIDSAHPRRTFYTLEPMPWMHPDSPDDYLRLIKDIDRPAFGVHLDYANMINSVAKYLDSAGFIRHCFSQLGPYIKSIHAKDVRLENSLPCHIQEVPPGEGIVDFGLVLRLTQALDDDMTLFVEHLSSFEKYKAATSHIRNIAAQNKIPVKGFTL